MNHNPETKYRLAKALRKHGLSDADLLRLWLHQPYHSEWFLTHQAEQIRLQTKDCWSREHVDRLVTLCQLYDIFVTTIQDEIVPF